MIGLHELVGNKHMQQQRHNQNVIYSEIKKENPLIVCQKEIKCSDPKHAYK
jgi:hypothetical protein